MKHGFLLLSLMTVVLTLMFTNAGTSQEKQEHQTIVESVEVNWWQVPIFAVDNSGKSVTDLKDTDIEVWVNKKLVEDFAFYKRAFTVSRSKEVPGEEDTPPPPALKKNEIFLLFDVTMSGRSCTKRSKEIAREIISSAEPGTQFNVLTIEPFKGLKYICGPLDNKKELLDKIDKKVIGKPNDRAIDPAQFFRGAGSSGSKRDQGSSGEEASGMSEQVAAYYKKKALSFFDAFETIYLIFNSIRDNKFIYFFTEGISNNIIVSSKGGMTEYSYNFKKAADSLGRSGAVLFIVNPLGVHDASALTTESKDANSAAAGSATSYFDKENSLSGEHLLRFMAKQSGGKYLEGVNREIVQTLEQMHQAYYEISFADIPGLKGTTRDITIKPKRKGVSIHSLRSLEKNKHYADMNKMEKELTALNLITQNPLMKSSLSSQHARVTDIKKNKNSIVYKILLPSAFLNQNLEVYKFWVKDDEEVIELESQSLETGKKKIKISFEIKEGQDPGLKPYFALVNGTNETALVRVIGDEWVDPEDAEKSPKQSIHLKKETIAAGELQNLLNGAADYCEKLKKSAFHFFCKEKIVETWKPVFSMSNRIMTPDIGQQGSDRWRDFPRTRIFGNVKPGANVYSFSYRLIKSDTKITEEREWLSSEDNVPISRDKVVKPTAFFSQRAIFAPLTILARERQDRYNFRFIGYDRYQGRGAAVVEAIPKNAAQENSIYGNVWIDREDYSILKIEADPRSIKGYQALREIEKKLNTRLFLSLEIDFQHIHEGIRFPTRVHMLQKYKGGRYVAKYSGPNGWERNRTIFTYSDYQFFAVNVEISINKN